VVDVLVILDGASEPLRPGEPTSLELAHTPTLDRLAREGRLTRVRTVAPGLVAGSEAAIPALLGWTPTAPVDRAALEAAAYGIAVRDGERAWRVDVVAWPGGCNESSAPGGDDSQHGGVLAGAQDDPQHGGVPAGGASGRACAGAVARAAGALHGRMPDHAVHRLRGHRLLLVGPTPLPAAAHAPGLRVWPEGIVPPQVLGPDSVVIGARGAAVGIARLMGAATVVPDGATGLPGSDLAAKAAAALDAIAAGAGRVVVHVGGPDEAAHSRDRCAKVAAIEHADRALLVPLVEAVREAGGTLHVCPDHGCDPLTGEHDSAPVPSVRWRPGDAGSGEGRVTERAVAELAVVDLPSAAALVAA
jgi:2,3-bisphosphoglycerate-independent phosphoglycerate mutase